MFASRYGQKSAVRLLLERGADIEGETAVPKWTSLHRACANGHYTTAEYLLSANEKLINHQDAGGNTPLMVATGYSKLVSTLIRRGANLELEDGEGKNALWTAAFNGAGEAIKVLTHSKEGRAIWILDRRIKHNEQMMTPLMVAANYGHVLAVRALLKAKANVLHTVQRVGSEPGHMENDVLCLAVKAGHMELVQLLLAAGVMTRIEEATQIATDDHNNEMVRESCLEPSSKLPLAFLEPSWKLL